MIFTELVLQNFGPYYGKKVIKLRQNKEEKNPPIVIFGGMNGGGKTTIMDAIKLALYGSRAQCSTRANLSYSDFLNQCVNNNAAKEITINKDNQTRIELSFEHFHYDSWKELKIVRYWSKNPKDGKDNLGILEGEWPDSGLTKTWDEYIETLLPLGISNLFLFDGEQVKELAEQEKPPQSVCDAICALLGLELVDKLAVDLDILASRKRKTLANKIQLENIEELEQKIGTLKKEKNLINETKSNLEQRLLNANIKHQENLQKFRQEGGKIAAEKSKLQTSIEHLKSDVEQQRELLRDLAAKLLPLNLILPLLEQAKMQGEKELKSEEAKMSLKILEERDQRLLDYLLSINSPNFSEINTFLNQENANLKQCINTQESPFLDLTETELQNLDNTLNIILPEQLQNARQLIQVLEDLETEIEGKEKQLAIAAAPEEYDKLVEMVEQSEKELRSIRLEIDQIIQKQDRNEKDLNQVTKQLEKYGENIIEDQESQHILNSINRVKNTLRIFKEKLTLKKLNKLEIEVSDCFRYLLHKSNLVHRVVINSRDFSLSIYDQNGHELPKHRLSAGEKQLLAIAFLWGLARVSGRNLPIVIDTPLGRLDSEHRNNLIERYFPTASHQVILLSTDTEIGKKEIEILRKKEVIAQEYLLIYEQEKRQTTVKEGYFW